MKKCPTCGNKYRPDVEECPNDGTRLSPGPAPAAPPGPPPPSQPTSSKRSSANNPKPATFSYDDISTGLTEKSTATSWIVSLLACGLLIGGYFVARDYIRASQAADSVEVSDDQATAKKKKRKRKRRGGKRNRAHGGDESLEDYDWEQDYVVDDSVLGDIFSEREEVVMEEPARVKPPEPYEPTREEYQPDGRYRPVASWSKPGAKSNVVEIDLMAPSGASPLDESAIKRVLNVRRLAPCYDPWVQKIPQMRGRVHMNFVIDGDGRVISVEIERSQLRSRVVERCIVKRARGFKFPSAQGGAKTRFDTHFDFTNR